MVAAYVLGSIPWAYLAGRLVKGIDLREHGSGNLGATNVYRLLGAPAAIAVLLLDAAKGTLSVLVLPHLIAGTTTDALAIACGIAAIVGHVRPVFLLWQGGGKGVATAAGVFAALAPTAFGAALAVFVVALLATRFMSVASISGALALPVAVVATRGARDPLTPVAVAVCAFVVWAHRSNLGRLRRGEEPRFGRRHAT